MDFAPVETKVSANKCKCSPLPAGFANIQTFKTQSCNWRAQKNNVLLRIKVTRSMLIQSNQKLHFLIASSPTSLVRWNQGHWAFGYKQMMLNHAAALASTSSVMWEQKTSCVPHGVWNIQTNMTGIFWILMWRGCQCESFPHSYKKRGKLQRETYFFYSTQYCHHIVYNVML